MRNLLQFILKHINFLLLLMLEVVALLLLISTHPYQQSSVLSTSNSLVARLNEMEANVGDYFTLANQNDHLAEENAQLRNELEHLRSQLEPSMMDTGNFVHSRDYKYISAKVVELTTSSNHNHLTINRGRLDGVDSQMGVIGPDGIVGIVSAVSDHYALVTPIIHTQMGISCRIASNSQVCFTEWSGTNYRYVRLIDVARHIPIEVNDTIVTSGITSVFPEGLMVGVVDDVKLTENDSYYKVKVRLSTDFRRLRYVQVICNPDKEEIEQLDASNS